MFIEYGTTTFAKNYGYFGEKEECLNCHKTYVPEFIRMKTWAHLSMVPIFPMKTRYYKSCPVCGASHELKSSEAKPLMVNQNTEQSLTPYIKHVLKNKPTKGVDTSYEVWVKDNVTGEEFCVRTGVMKNQIKDIRKDRGLKKIETVEVA